MQPKTTELPKDFGERLRWFRNQRGISQGDLGKSVERSPTSISEWEKGTTEPSLDQIATMAEVLKVSPARLAYGELGVEEAQADYVKSRKEGMGDLPKSPVDKRQMTIAPQFSAPSTRRDCEVYFTRLLDLAQASGNPNAFPSIMDKLEDFFPLRKYDRRETDT